MMSHHFPWCLFTHLMIYSDTCWQNSWVFWHFPCFSVNQAFFPAFLFFQSSVPSFCSNWYFFIYTFILICADFSCPAFVCSFFFLNFKSKLGSSNLWVSLFKLLHTILLPSSWSLPNSQSLTFHFISVRNA